MYMKDIEQFITDLKETSPNLLPGIYTNGDCFKLANFLQKYFPEGEIYLVLDEEGNPFHAVLKYNDSYWDINGEFSLPNKKLKLVEFDKNKNKDLFLWSTEKNNIILRKNYSNINNIFANSFLNNKDIKKLKNNIDEESLPLVVEDINISITSNIIYKLFNRMVEILKQLPTFALFILFSPSFHNSTILDNYSKIVIYFVILWFVKLLLLTTISIIKFSKMEYILKRN